MYACKDIVAVYWGHLKWLFIYFARMKLTLLDGNYIMGAIQRGIHGGRKTILCIKQQEFSLYIVMQSKVVVIPREQMIQSALNTIKCKVVLVGDACDGEIVTALASMFDKEKITPQSQR